MSDAAAGGVILAEGGIEHPGERTRFGDVVIVGGGCYGAFYAGQLLRAIERGKVALRRLIVVDRDPGCRFAREIGPSAGRELVVADWDEFFDRYLHGETGSPDPDIIVPSPLMPHLMYRWLVRRATARWPGRRVETRPLGSGPRTPYDVPAPDGTRYLSYADWTCPTHCIEPATCPVTRAPRTWEMAEALEVLARQHTPPLAGPVLFTCRHRAHGVGAFDRLEVQAGDLLVAGVGAAGTEADVLVGTVSSCHGAVNRLHLGPSGS
ncbi:MAG: hypothetical protein OEW17_09585 [Gemmatimonadota bacterium]|nr:hypothetical protein [Gemmatimonadota bacterium]MDH4349047.1 hypothetical protein [Gemmatimonadota bacterium]